MTKRNRFLTTLLTIAVAFVMLTSVAYIAKESHHDCVGDNGAICHQLNACQHFLKDLGFGGMPVCMAKTQYSFSDDQKKLGAPRGFRITERVRTYVARTPSLTLVSLKVKLSN